MPARVSLTTDYETKEWKDAKSPLVNDLRHMMIVINRMFGLAFDENNIIRTEVINEDTPIAIELTGDVSGGPSTSPISTTIGNDKVTFAKMQNISTDRLIGRDTAGTGDPEQLTVGGGVEFTGSGGIQRSALTGDVTASAGSGTTTIANDAVTYAKMQNVTASRLLGRGDSGSGDPQELTVGSGLSLIGTDLSASGGHVHGLMRVLGDGSSTTFDLLDVAEYLEHIAVNGSIVDPATFTLSADGTQITFDSVPGVGEVIALEYVIAGV